MASRPREQRRRQPDIGDHNAPAGRAVAPTRTFNGEIDAAIRSLGGSVDGKQGKPRSKPTLVGVPGVTRLRPVERALAYQILATAYVAKKDYEAAIGVYESILELGTRAAAWHREVSNMNLALIHFSRKDYEKSLEYQRAWLGISSSLRRACPRVC